MEDCTRILVEAGPVSMEMKGVETPTVDGLTNVYVIGPANTRVQLYDGDPSRSTTTYVRGLSLVAAVAADGTRTYYHYNAHGDVVQLTNSSGTVTRDYTYDAFGVEKNADSSDTNLFRYCGEQYDSETGNYYLRARYYSPATGRFTQEDTHWNPGNMVYGDEPQKWNTWQGKKDTLNLHAYTYKPQATAIAQVGNLYTYVVNDPVMYRDSTGQFAITTAIAIGALVGILIGGYSGAKISQKKHGEIRWYYVVGGAILGGVAGGLIGWGAGAVVAKLGSYGAAHAITTGTGGAGFASFNKLKDFLGSAGSGFQWHHIVEQCQIGKSGFSTYWINNSNNVVQISNTTHAKISGYYSSIQSFTQGMRVRDWLAGQSFETQYEFGIKVLRQFGVNI